MILINNIEFDDEMIDQLILFLEDAAVTPAEKEYAVIYKKYLEDCRDLDKKIQEEVHLKITPDLISLVNIPYDELDDFNTLNVQIVASPIRDLKKREKLLFNQIVEKNLKYFQGVISRLE